MLSFPCLNASKNALRTLAVASVCACALLVSGCAETQLASHYAKQVTWPGEQVGNSSYKVGKPYRVGNDWYYPSEDFSKSETGIASWYGPNFHGKRTANGEIYDQNELTAAHRTLQMPSLVRVTNLDNGRSIVVRINDRGPFKKGRVIDVSKRAAELLGFIGNGTARVRVDVLEKESRKIATAAQRGMDTSRITLAELNSLPDGGTGAAQVSAVSAQPIMAANEMPRIQQASFDTNSLRGNMPSGRFVSASQDNMLPESLRTPTITVEELNRADARATTFSPVDGSRRKIAGVTTDAAVPPPGQPEFSGHVDQQGRFMPNDVVQQQPVVPTGLFVQAGSFGVKDNAERLSQQLSSIAPTRIDPVEVNGKTLYRVKLGPLADLVEADAVLAKVAQAGTAGAKVINTP